jgi:PhnB protein
MKELVPYLNFDGTTEKAMAFYAKCLDAELQLMKFADIPGDIPPGSENRIMHARLSKGRVTIMASDTMPGTKLESGTNFSLSLHCESMAEIQQHFAALSENGKVTMPLEDTFWGAHFGMLEDQFGVKWMFNFEKPKA